MTGCHPRLRNRRTTTSWTASSMRAARCSRVAGGCAPAGIDATPVLLTCSSCPATVPARYDTRARTHYRVPAVRNGLSGGHRQLAGRPLLGPPEFARHRLLDRGAGEGAGRFGAQCPQCLGRDLGVLPGGPLPPLRLLVPGEPVGPDRVAQRGLLHHRMEARVPAAVCVHLVELGDRDLPLPARDGGGVVQVTLPVGVLAGPAAPAQQRIGG